MTAIIFYSKFIWADWLLDHAVRRCSPAARALWIDMLAVSVRSEPVGVLSDGDVALTPADIARVGGMSKNTALRLIAELESNGVFSRDAQGRIYSRRVVREHRARLNNKANGARGGNPQLAAGNNAAPDNPHKLEVKSQESEATSQQSPDRAAPSASPVAPLLRAVEAMGTTLDALHRKPAWSVFGDTFATWLEEGADAERDVWPTIAKLTARRRKPPASPAYFTEAVREARDKRRDGTTPAPRTLGAPYLASTAHTRAPWVSPEEQADRLAVFKTHGLWAKRWGPKPEQTSEDRHQTSEAPRACHLISAI
jgi:hypothetical protein